MLAETELVDAEREAVGGTRVSSDLQVARCTAKRFFDKFLSYSRELCRWKAYWEFEFGGVLPCARQARFLFDEIPLTEDFGCELMTFSHP
jgi:hypothetical protein